MKNIDEKDLRKVSGGGNVGDVSLRTQDDKPPTATPVKTTPGGSIDPDRDTDNDGGLGDIGLG